VIAVSIPVALHSQATSVPVFNGLNFSDWSEKVQFHLGVLDLDLAIRIEKSAAITDDSSNEEKAHYRVWEKSNRLSLMFMRMSITNNIKCALPKIKNAKEFMKFVEERSQNDDKSLAETLMSTSTTMNAYYVCFESNLTEVPYNSWWIDSGCTTHVSNMMQGFLST